MIGKTTLSLSLLLGLVLGLAPAARAQTDFRPGYVVLPAGDTLRGEVDFRGARRNSQLCQFRASATAQVQQWRPAALRAYGYRGGDAYRAALTPLPDSTGKASARRMTAAPSRQFPLAPRRLFLQVLADGPAVLYARCDDLDAVLYYLQKTGTSARPVQQLPFRREAVELDGQRFNRDVNAFRDTLALALADCPAVLPAVAGTAFKESALVGLVNRYNECRQPGLAPRPVAVAQAHITLGVLAGAQVSELVFTGMGAVSAARFVARPAVVLGLALQLTNPAISHKLALRLEAHYAQQRYEAEYKIASFTNDASEQARFRASYLRLPVLLRYSAPHGAVRPLAEVGFVASAALGIEGETRTRFISSVPFSAWKSALDPENRSGVEVGVLAGLGLQFGAPGGRALFLMARAERSSGFATVFTYDTYVWRYNALLGFNLTK